MDAASRHSDADAAATQSPTIQEPIKDTNDWGAATATIHPAVAPGTILSDAVESTSKNSMGHGLRAILGRKTDDEESVSLLTSLRENGTKTGLMAKLAPQSVVNLSNASASVNKARQKFLARQKAYIQKLAEKRQQEEEQQESEKKRTQELRERLKGKVLSKSEDAGTTAKPLGATDENSDSAIPDESPVNNTLEKGRRSTIAEATPASTSQAKSARQEAEGEQQEMVRSLSSPGPRRPRIQRNGASSQSYMRKTESMQIAEKWNFNSRSPYLSGVEPLGTTKEDRQRQFARWKDEFRLWREQRGLSEDTKVFSVLGGYHDLRRSLKCRGWVENKDVHSDFFHLRWCLKPKNIQEERLVESQIVNHFRNSFQCLTTKFGLLKSLKTLVWHFDTDMNTFFPRCYNLSDEAECVAFDVDFKRCAARSVLKRVLKDGRFHPAGVPNHETVEAAITICRSHLAFCRDLIEEDVHDGNAPQLPSNLTEAQWKLVLECPIFNFGKDPKRKWNCKRKRTGKKRKGDAMLQRTESEADSDSSGGWHVDSSTDSDSEWGSEDGESSGENSTSSSDSDSGPASPTRKVSSPRPKSLALLKKKMSVLGKKAARVGSPERKRMDPGDAFVGGGSEVPEWIVSQAKEVLDSLSSFNVQDGMDGCGNIWILKPGGKSRGRGISCFNSLKHIRQGARLGSSGDGCAHQWVIQKYIENPMIVHKRKFDIRQWVVVTSWDPLTIWFYDQCYVRFCAEDFSLRDIDNMFCHLSNNCVARRSKKFLTERVGEGNMWSNTSFSEHLQKRYGKDVWEEKLQPRIKQIVLYSLASAQESIIGRKNSHELYGYDFMVDENLETWLLEINCSPSLEHSTSVTSTLVKAMISDLVKVVWDVPEHIRNNRPSTSLAGVDISAENADDYAPRGSHESDPSPDTSQTPHGQSEDAGPSDTSIPSSEAMKAYSASIEGCDTGDWSLLYRGESVGTFGGPKILSNPLLLKGQQCKIYRYRVASVKTFSTNGEMGKAKMASSSLSGRPARRSEPPSPPQAPAARANLRSLKPGFLLVRTRSRGRRSSCPESTSPKNKGPTSPEKNRPGKLQRDLSPSKRRVRNFALQPAGETQASGKMHTRHKPSSSPVEAPRSSKPVPVREISFSGDLESADRQGNLEEIFAKRASSLASSRRSPVSTVAKAASNKRGESPSPERVHMHVINWEETKHRLRLQGGGMRIRDRGLARRNNHMSEEATSVGMSLVESKRGESLRPGCVELRKASSLQTSTHSRARPESPRVDNRESPNPTTCTEEARMPDAHKNHRSLSMNNPRLTFEVDQENDSKGSSSFPARGILCAPPVLPKNSHTVITPPTAHVTRLISATSRRRNKILTQAWTVRPHAG
ncbi:hypothetical protein BSKO_10484 [Bryopsis sp. KO-2023]|nr:hypothetical protein BSKO_10484 [Bryopsis sp. KO-2023]